MISFVVPAMAQEQQPCQRTGPRAAGGVDMDGVRCQLYLSGQRVAQLSADADQFRAGLVMAGEDMKRLQQEREVRERDMALWFKGWFGRETAK